jgi:predicted acylesterase/phospholipase RssA
MSIRGNKTCGSLSFSAGLFSLFLLFQEQKRPSPAGRGVGLVLGGGGAKGAAHVGVIKVLEKLRIPIDFIAGTSMGSIVGSLYASGLSVDQLEKVLTEEIKAGKVKVAQGDATEAAQILDYFDKYEPARNVTIPTLHD